MKIQLRRNPMVDFETLEAEKSKGSLIASALKIWKDCYWRFFKIKHARVDGVDVKILNTILRDIDFDLWKFEGLCYAFFNEHKTKQYFRERNLMPKISKLCKFRDEFLEKARSFTGVVSQFHKYREIYDILGIHPLTKISNEIVFGLDLPDFFKKEGYDMCDVYRIEGRSIWILDRESLKLKEILGYAHFGEDIDPITNEITMVNSDDLIFLKLDEINEFYKKFWHDKTLRMRTRRKEFERWMKPE